MDLRDKVTRMKTRGSQDEKLVRREARFFRTKKSTHFKSGGAMWCNVTTTTLTKHMTASFTEMIFLDIFSNIRLVHYVRWDHALD